MDSPVAASQKPARKPRSWAYVLGGLSAALLIVTAVIGVLVAQDKIWIHMIPRGQVVASYAGTLGMNHIDVYQDGKRVCVDTYSQSEFDRPEQYCFQVETPITKDDISVTWLHYFGPRHTVEPQSKYAAVAEVKIKSGDKTVFEKPISFVEKGIAVLEKVMKSPG
ncbi:hypothetical protein BK816_01595 [Boudabousia tangfeifanii]|uniref:Uncharacterized protein n=1 Tax=Boudabousia tangfeifanii TaxID=1912795 RepID=A0A1D9MIZ1_9ACTO|nr:hypothetical protein [Boudabousia tangfeifanii]AOZ72150.1 hypothetical protein BK816_01595 [Boudabousia tangfeifanii]